MLAEEQLGQTRRKVSSQYMHATVASERARPQCWQPHATGAAAIEPWLASSISLPSFSDATHLPISLHAARPTYSIDYNSKNYLLVGP